MKNKLSYKKTKKKRKGMKKQRRVTGKYRGGSGAAAEEEKLPPQRQYVNKPPPRNNVLDTQVLVDEIAKYLRPSNVKGRSISKSVKVIRDTLLNQVTAIKPKDHYRREISDHNLTFLKSPAFINLTNIDLNFTNVTDIGLQTIAESCPNLIKIFLKSTFIKDVNGQAFAPRWGEDGSIQGGFPNLTIINIADTSITDAGIQAIANSCPNLEEIYLRDTEITDTGLQALAPRLGEDSSLQGGCPNLTTIDLRDNTNITNDGVLEIANRCIQLKTIDLRGCEEITYETVKNLVGGFTTLSHTCPNLENIGYDLQE